MVYAINTHKPIVFRKLSILLAILILPGHGIRLMGERVGNEADAEKRKHADYGSSRNENVSSLAKSSLVDEPFSYLRPGLWIF